MAILVLFEQFLRKFCLNFLTLNLSVSQNITHFVRIFSIMRALGVGLIVIEKDQKYGKLHLSKTCLKMAGGGIHPSHPPLDSPPPTLITMSLTITPTSRFGFSMM